MKPLEGTSPTDLSFDVDRISHDAVEGKELGRVVKGGFIVFEDLIIGDTNCFALSPLLTGKMRWETVYPG